ncbi:c-type cytochrome biogenesis protein CcmI [Pseudoalteromonas sp. SR44-5]|uniref:c-type cytochrome biogenesis protein CcmI n=1 Tax=unclassified Pseudoalteromonas TaxID=194690 RepID=UPI0016013117|nr:MULTISPECIES: c-type cytochrome biogenesis protein CcmI [unclassified Pseudoalteromonas]MBB1332935.1 c-type cytochrome biogenesis protein CcmI [Pseudoalteromonas sp. SR41-6]MBB1341202.1 c-type cytochrome biogenesis protein CcmI [Pseudoalteromonas sp. SR45-6]MBB1366681.1 c-type cytochrome biogenesis protein CcmI [Pseudoalteromonas sp. SR44-5]MBB1458178.1 c-type cytochrome biogenesis protein CcmI [Pseudoalteromonas sp. SG41-8]MBB1467705.1 c-type cytochrome biogenesis protein CcmI [Pseudoalter
MILMWVSFALLTLLAVAFVALPFLSKERVQSLTYNANSELIAIYHQRLGELANDLANQRIDQVNHDESVIELKRRLLNELSPEKSLMSRGNNRIFALTGSAFLIAFTAVFYTATGSQQQLQNWHSAMDNLAAYGERAVMQQGEPLTQNELQAFALGLRTKLAQSGDDQVAWMLLGRVAMSLNEYDMAQQSFDKVLRMDPDNMPVLISYSQVLLLEGSDVNMTRAAGMLSKVLKDDPTNLDAISLLALIAYERHDWLQAKAAFEVLLKSMDEQDTRYDMIAQRITEIEQNITAENTQLAPALQPQAEQGSGEDNNAAKMSAIKVTVNLAPQLADKLPIQGTLFVFAKAANGPPMPLAVVKLTDYSFPIEVQLSDSNAMVAGLTLSSVDKIILTARISKDASVMPSTGELEGRSDVLERSQTKAYDLLINELIP